MVASGEILYFELWIAEFRFSYKDTDTQSVFLKTLDASLKKLTTLIDLNYLQGLQARLIIAEIKYRACKDQTVGIRNGLSYIAAYLLIVTCIGYNCRRSFLQTTIAGYRKLSR